LVATHRAISEVRNGSNDIGGIVIVFGLILLLIGFVTGIPFVWSIGMFVLIVGLVLWILGSTGRAVGGRKHYY
jgi:uncharacterized protein DUF6131